MDRANTDASEGGAEAEKAPSVAPVSFDGDLALRALHAADVAVMATDPRQPGNPITFVNDAFVRQTGYSREEIIGKDAAILNGPNTDIAQVIALRRRLLEGRPTVVELLTYRKDGSTWWNRVHATPIAGAGGGIDTILYVKSDITEHHVYEEALRDAKEQADVANCSKSEFMAILGHELRSPLNAVLGFSEIMMNEQLGPVGTPKYKGYAKDIHFTAKLLLDLINDLLDLSKAEAGKMEIEHDFVSLVDVLDAVTAMVRERARMRQIVLSVQIAPDFPTLSGDERKLKQVMLNLLTNAIKFSNPGGTVTVAAEREAAEGGVVISVRDAGIGIRPEDIPLVLAPYGQVRNRVTKSEGTGLGLPLTKRLIELHDGRLSIDSAPGEGTTVSIRLPPDRVLANPA